MNDLKSYRKKVSSYLKQHQDDLVVFKLRHNQALTPGDFKYLEKLLWHDLGTRDEYQDEFGDEPLLKLVASLVGLDQAAANRLFSEFITDQSLNSNQMDFVTLVVNHVVKNGLLEKKILNDHPFNIHGNIVTLFDGRLETARNIVKCIDELNDRLAVQG